MTQLPFRDRRQAGRVLAEQLTHYAKQPRLLILALPRGGVVVGYEVARALQAPLDVQVVRKLGLPGQEEYAMGAIAGGGVCVMNSLAGLMPSADALAAVVAREQAELLRREQRYRGQRAPPQLRQACVIVVDDGLATGSTMRAALQAIGQQQPVQLVAAVPVGAADTCQALRDEGYEVICALTPQPFRAVGQWYEDFLQVSDEEVCALLQQAWREHP
ncbi:Predicted phosphoribosyltransferase [Polaromonas sp. OV174]|uniref:phosphoribosyltransferase n=1 Tax=Polaromonas sp. OV174 TaxID=1855300 RepID=UPI0008E9505A|nr:phosphoribosyltransferase [Polaromonas sp. OV174]SFC55739.1 Predicted phosphoribosyltransferase [Polaromonas sp. OV174]